MEKIEAIYDITLMLGGDAIDYANLPKYCSEQIWKLEKGNIANVSRLEMTSHHGTHVDVPFHFIPKGKKLDEFPIERWIRPAHVVSIRDKEAIRPSELEHLDIEPGDALLFKTDNSMSGLITSEGFSEKFVYMSPEAADFCVEKEVGLVGIDYYSLDRLDDEEHVAHHKILGNDILILEAINLQAVPPGKYTLFCLPLNLKGVDASPVRAVLVR